MSQATGASVQERQVLAVVDGVAWYQNLLPLLRRAACKVRRVADGAAAQLMIANAGFDLLVAQYPIKGLSVVDLLETLREPGSPSAGSAVLIIAPEDQAESLAEHLAPHSVEVRPDATPPDRLILVASRLLGVATRTDSRSLVHLEAEVGGDRISRMCQIRNLSQSGMLLRTSRVFPIGTQFNVAFHLPEDPYRIEALVRVVRHTEERRESLAGMGLKFVRFQPGSDQRLQSYLETSLAEAEAPPQPAVAENQADHRS